MKSTTSSIPLGTKVNLFNCRKIGRTWCLIISHIDFLHSPPGSTTLVVLEADILRPLFLLLSLLLDLRTPVSSRGTTAQQALRQRHRCLTFSTHPSTQIEPTTCTHTYINKYIDVRRANASHKRNLMAHWIRRPHTSSPRLLKLRSSACTLPLISHLAKTKILIQCPLLRKN